jgi:hypothetical protein
MPRERKRDKRKKDPRTPTGDTICKLKTKGCSCKPQSLITVGE